MVDPELQKSIAAILQKALQGIEAGTDFLKNQLPDVLQQLLTYSLYFDVISIALVWVYLFSYVILVVFFFRRSLYEDDHVLYPLPFLITLVGLGAAVLLIGIILIPDIYDIVKIAYAPKLFLLEYAAHLAHPTN
jgi:hypothetical protein